MAAAGEKTLAHSELKRSLIGASHGAFIRALSLVYSFRNKDGGPLRASWSMRSAFFRVWNLKGGLNSVLIVWKTVTVPLEGKHSKFADLILASIGVQHVFKVPAAIEFQLSIGV